MEPHLYAELLPNIHQVSVIASLPSPVDASTTTATLLQAPESSILVLRHGGSQVSITLPGKVIFTDATLPIPQGAIPLTELSWRLRLASPSQRSSSDALSPWQASSLSSTTQVHCRSCTHSLLTFFENREWKDLPSENWAEMMELWHCHKPVVHDEDVERVAGKVKGYGAEGGKVEVKAGVGFVDLGGFVLSPEECQGCEVWEGSRKTENGQGKNPSRDETEAKPLLCKQCGSFLGLTDPSTTGWRLQKAFLSLSYCPGPKILDAPDAEFFLSAQLLSLAETQGARRFAIYSDPRIQLPSGGRSAQMEVEKHRNVEGPLLLWLLNPSIYYATSETSTISGKPIHAVKMLTQGLSAAKLEDILSNQTTGVEEVALPAPVMQMVWDAMRRSEHDILRGSAGDGPKGWKAALLARM